MRIVELTAHHVRVPLKRTIKHASHARTETDNVVVRCVLGDGTVGYGEGVPRDYVTGETVESSIQSLTAAGLPTQLTPCTTFADAIDVATRLTISRNGRERD